LSSVGSHEAFRASIGAFQAPGFDEAQVSPWDAGPQGGDYSGVISTISGTEDSIRTKAA